MKGYKIFNNDWTCRGYQFEVGKEYSHSGPLELCKSGFHFCEKLEDCFESYYCNSQYKFAEVEATGNIINDNYSSKRVTDKIKIIREICFSDIEKFVSEHGVLSAGAIASEGIMYSPGVIESKCVIASCGVLWSRGIVKSVSVTRSDGVSTSRCVRDSLDIVQSECVLESKNIGTSHCVALSENIVDSMGVVKSEGVMHSKGVTLSYGVINSDGVNNSLFVADRKSDCLLFGKPVSPERIAEVKEKLHVLLKGWSPRYDIFKSLSLKYGSAHSHATNTELEELRKKDAWASMPQEAIDYLKTLPEFDADIFEKVTGIGEENETNKCS